MGINVLVFIFVNLNNSLLALLALQPGALFNMPWTLFTSIFTHIDLWHILFNMFTFFFFGRFVMNLVGTGYMLLIYLVGGIVGSLFFAIMAPNHAAIGASGAVYALGGSLIVLRPQIKVIMFPLPIPIPLWVAILIGFLILLIPGATGIAWQAHLGGLVFGLAAGFFLRKKVRVILF
jgi:membrane associated rhomboid family serine protease